MDRARARAFMQALAEVLRLGEPPGMKFRIAAGQPDHVAGPGRAPRRRAGENGMNLGSRRAPAIEQMRIDEAEGCIAGERDALAGRSDG